MILFRFGPTGDKKPDWQGGRGKAKDRAAALGVHIQPVVAGK